MSRKAGPMRVLAAIYTGRDYLREPLHETEPMRTYALLCVAGNQAASIILMIYLGVAAIVVGRIFWIGKGTGNESVR